MTEPDPGDDLPVTGRQLWAYIRADRGRQIRAAVLAVVIVPTVLLFLALAVTLIGLIFAAVWLWISPAVRSLI